jgi:hypothetical protein
MLRGNAPELLPLGTRNGDAHPDEIVRFVKEAGEAKLVTWAGGRPSETGGAGTL